jgi:hypothetical protein
MCFPGEFGDFFIFLFSNRLRLDHPGLTAINEVDPLGLRRQQMENCEGRENSIMLSLPELSHWHLRDSLGEKPHLRNPNSGHLAPRWDVSWTPK